MRYFIITLILIVAQVFVNEGFSQEKNQALNEALYNMRQEVTNSSVIYADKTSPTIVTSNAFYLYVVMQNDQMPKLKLRIQYFGSLRLDVYEYILKNNDNSLRLQADLINKSYSDFGNYNSWCDIDVTPSVLEFLRAISGSSMPKLEYVGSYNNRERRLSKNEVQAMINVIKLYNEMIQN